MTALLRGAAALLLSGQIALAWADSPTPAARWTMDDLNQIAQAALAAAPAERIALMRSNRLLKLGDALAGAGDLPAAHSIFIAAASIPVDQVRVDTLLKASAIDRLVRWGFVEDAEQLVNSASDPELKGPLSTTLQRAHNGLPNPDPFFAPPPNIPPEQNADALAAARDFLKEGRVAEAREEARRAQQAALAAAGLPNQSTAQRIAHHNQLGQVFAVLCDLGEYDEAIATVQPIEDVNRKQYYAMAIEAAVGAHDDAAVNHLLPVAIAAFKEPAPDWGTVQKLHRVIQALGRGGYRDAARTAFAELKAVLDTLVASGKYQADLDMLAECQALTGDLAGALATADKAGPLVQAPSNGQVAMATVFSFADEQRKAPPTQNEIAQRLAEVQAHMPAQVLGPKAFALAAIANDLALMGDIKSALGMEAALEGEPRKLFEQQRDFVLTPISEAQQTAGQYREALATALRISRDDLRFARLLKLAAVPPQP